MNMDIAEVIGSRLEAELAARGVSWEDLQAVHHFSITDVQSIINGSWWPRGWRIVAIIESICDEIGLDPLMLLETRPYAPVTDMTAASKSFQRHMKDPEYAAAYHAARECLDQEAPEDFEYTTITDRGWWRLDSGRVMMGSLKRIPGGWSGVVTPSGDNAPIVEQFKTVLDAAEWLEGAMQEIADHHAERPQEEQ